MSKPAPLQYGNYYHIYNRGNNRENIFIEERNYHYFLELYAKYIEQIADTFAYCLLRNHFHFFIRVKEISEFEDTSKIPSPSHEFGNLFNAYAKAINKAYGRTGSLFQNPFGRNVITSEEHLHHLIIYIHRNPQKHGFVADYRAYPFSSYQAMISNKRTQVQRETVLSWFDGYDHFVMCHEQEMDDSVLGYLVSDDI
jgi:REP element-mobilizing transposase RayT